MADITDPAIDRYATDHTSPEPPHLTAHAQATREAYANLHHMMVGPLEGRFLKMLVAVSRARRILEIGTFTGYSALSMAEALPPDGRIVTCELDADRAAMARRAFADAGVADRIEVHVGPAIDTVRTLEGPFDLCFIDADKSSYPAYYEAALPLLTQDGLIVVDNVLRSGRVLDADPDPDTRAIKSFNDAVAADQRVECVLLPIRDGVTLIRKRGGAGG